ncbi:MAG: glycosyltransferase family 2 protein [Ignavibacteria bacterium]|jgi:glycosyltransferase involved in cell wall biosynthesis|nr:glycosyltransferase family 2 protein [Ignavibacteria bacterium]MCU7502041.1 glycosyltransferase family 2 protein [Ignavibacteria bacterium]MCU7515443.1 glycosyltransferase family 2 protein [Ignavibacteria bacterium]
MIKISSIILAKDEENNIARCIDSQQGSIDEILVFVDSRTTDNTVNILKSKGVSYEVCTWQGYAKTKQYALSKASNEWILWIDADEALTPELKSEIIEFKASQPVYNVYSIPRKANFLGKWIMHSGWYPGRVERLFNKNHAHFSNKDVHEHLVFEGQTGKLNHDLEHYTDPSIKHYFDKFNVYTSLAAEELFRKNRTASVKDILLRPPFLFFKMYIMKRGFLDGLMGFMLAVFSSLYVFTKYSKLWELEHSRVPEGK